MYLPIDSKKDIEGSAPALAKELYSNCTWVLISQRNCQSDMHFIPVNIQALESANVRRVTTTSSSLTNVRRDLLFTKKL
jgi:hypothetical protein